MNIYILVLLSLGAVIGIFKFIKSNPRLREIKLDNSLGGIIFGGLIAVYSLILAFVVIVVWQQYQAAGDRIETEASKLSNVKRATYAFRDSINELPIRQLRTDIDSYVASVQHSEWRMMEHDSASRETQAVYDSILKRINQVTPVTEAEKAWYDAAIRNLYQFSEARHTRLADKDYDIPLFMWLMLIVGAAVIIIFTIFLKSDNNSHHLMKVLMMTIMILFSLLLVDLLDHPFKGAMKIDPEPFQKISVGNW